MKRLTIADLTDRQFDIDFRRFKREIKKLARTDYDQSWRAKRRGRGAARVGRGTP